MKKFLVFMKSFDAIRVLMSRWGRAVLWWRKQRLKRDHRLPSFPGRTVIVAYGTENLSVLLYALELLGVWPDSINSLETPNTSASGPFLLIKPDDTYACTFMRTLVALGPVRILSVRLQADKIDKEKIHITWEDVTSLFVDEAAGKRNSLPEERVRKSLETLSIPPKEE